MKLFSKMKKELKTLIHTIRIYSQDIGMEFGIEKMRHGSNGKRQMTPDGRNGSTNQDKIRTHKEKETYEYLGKLEADSTKPEEMKERNKKEYFNRA